MTDKLQLSEISEKQERELNMWANTEEEATVNPVCRGTASFILHAAPIKGGSPEMGVKIGRQQPSANMHRGCYLQFFG